MASTKSKRDKKDDVPLIEQVIAIVEKKGLAVLGMRGLTKPAPMAADALAKLRFPRREKPSPSLRRWLAFDASWLTKLGWLDKKGFTPKSIAEFADIEYGPGAGGNDGFGLFAEDLPGDLYLLPGGSDERRALYVGIADSAGEHPVILTDNDDLPRVALLYPGFDVFMADLVGIDLGSVPMARHPLFKTRMNEHTHRNFGGRPDRDLGDLHEPEAHLAPIPYLDGDPVPPGFEVTINPFTQQKVLVRS